MSLWSEFKNNKGKIIHKWQHYFPIYERYLSPWKNKTITLLEIGVSKGGSLQMWQNYLGPLATVIGIDLDEKCVQHESDNIHIRIGNQSDLGFLADVVDEFGCPDIVIDDGSHIMSDIWASFEFLYPKVSKNGVYIVEDLHTAYWEEFGGGLNISDTFINKSKSLVDQLNAEHSRGVVSPTEFTRSTFGISFYDSIVVFEKGNIPMRSAPQIGNI